MMAAPGGVAHPARLCGPAVWLSWRARWRRRRGQYDRLTLALFTLVWRRKQDAEALCRLALFRRDLGLPLPRRWAAPLRIGLATLPSALRRRALGLLAESDPQNLQGLDEAWLADAAARQPGVATARGGEFALHGSLGTSQEALRLKFAQWLAQKLAERGGDGAAAGVCAVGHGPGMVGSALGAEIDRHAVVLRFNRWQSRGADPQDVGCRADVWVVAPDMDGPVPQGLSWAVVSGPDPRYVVRHWALCRRLAEAGVPVLTLPLPVWRSLVQSLEAPPSAGLLILAWLRALLGGWQGVVAVGIGLGRGPEGRHRWDAEFAQMAVWRSEGLGELRHSQGSDGP